jgi:hypothetical protein
MTNEHARDLDYALQFFFREQQDEGSYWNLFIAFLIQKGRETSPNIDPEIREYWEMIIKRTIDDGYIEMTGPAPRRFSRTIKGREFFNGVPEEWRGRPYAYHHHHHHH